VQEVHGINKGVFVKTLIIAFFLMSIPAVAANLTLEVRNIEEAKGNLCYAIVNKNSADIFPENTEDDENAILDCIEITDTEDIVLEFSDLPNMTYAISVFHDENGNKKLDANFMQIPKEPLGLSIVKKMPWRKPNFDECSFDLEEDKTITISLKSVF
jgi:uncharacterized protein (DUF2141 family)